MAASPQHGLLDPTLQGIHVPYQWVYADAATRAAATGFIATDVGKLAFQSDNSTLWLLSATTPTWVQVTGVGSGYGTATEIADVAAAESAGVSDLVPRADHVHAHGSGYSADAHHAQSHAHDGADGSGTVAHADTTGQTTDDHHAQLHKAAHTAGQPDALASTDEIELQAIRTHLRVGATGAPTTSAALDITSTDGAILVPRMTTGQRNALTASDGMVIYNTTTSTFQVRRSGAWEDLGTSGASLLNVKEADGAPDVANVISITVTNGTLTDNGSGSVTIATGGGAGGGDDIMSIAYAVGL